MPGAPEPKAYRPPFWQSKIYGEPFGDFNRRDPPREAVDRKGKKGQEGEDYAKPYSQEGLVVGGNGLQALEDRMRAQLKKRRALHVKEKDLLMKAFLDAGAVVPEQGKAAIGPRWSATEAARIRTREFCAAWAKLGVRVEDPEAAALFNKYGQDSQGLLPCKVFVEALLVGRSRLLARVGAVKDGAFEAGKSGEALGKIRYPQSRKGVYAPSDWDPQKAVQSSSAPDGELDLEYVYGYSGIKNTSNNLWYNSEGRAVYYTAGVGIVYDKASNTQRYFQGHDDDIRCLAMSPCRRLAATGQMGKFPVVCVWDTRGDAGTSCRELVRIKHGAVRFVVACTFSPDGNKLATLGADNYHTLSIWDWRKEPPQLLWERGTMNGTPPQVYGVVWSPHIDQVITYGVNHIKFWTIEKKGQKGAPCKVGLFGKGRPHTVTSCTVLPSGTVATGNQDGQLCLWQDFKLKEARPAHSKGPPVTRPDGTKAYSGLRCLCLRADGRTLLSAGADGSVITWALSADGHLGAMAKTQKVESPNGGRPIFKGLACRPESDEFMAGTHSADIWEIDKDPEMLVFGHAGDLYGVCCHPTVPRVFVTACESDKLVFFDIKRRRKLRSLSMGERARCVAFSPSGSHMAVGMTSGTIRVLDFKTIEPIFTNKDLTQGVADLKFSPDGHWLAAASNDTFIDVFDRQKGYAKTVRCAGHSSTVRHIDWSADSRIIQSNSSDYEILYWDPRTGRQVRQNQRDTEWDTWTCVLGFPVMGIWKEGSDGTDVNSVDRSKSGRCLATADDYGCVNLYAWPCVVERAPTKAYFGHSSHVMNVRFNADDSRLVSVGGKDRAVFQWRTRFVAAGEEPPSQRPVVSAPWASDDVDKCSLLDGLP